MSGLKQSHWKFNHYKLPQVFFSAIFSVRKKKVYIGTYQIAYADSDISVIGHYRPTNILIGLSTKQRNDHKIYGVFFMTE